MYPNRESFARFEPIPHLGFETEWKRFHPDAKTHRRKGPIHLYEKRSSAHALHSSRRTKSAAPRGRAFRRSASSISEGQTEGQEHSAKRASVRALAVVAVLLGLLGSSAIIRGASATPVGGTSSTAPSLSQVQEMYAQDLVDRINAERAARSNAQVAIPQLQVNATLAADAQEWANEIASTGTVSDPTLPPCPEQAATVCALAANSGDSGYGFWPGDGSDGMNGDYMQSAPHRQNMLGAEYDQVGVGVTCSGGQAWTVEIFGYAYGELSSAYARESSQDVLQGNPVPATPEVAGPQTGDPVYCPGQTYGPNGEITATGGQYPYPYPVPPVPNEAGNVGVPVVGVAATPDSEGYWIVRADGSLVTRGDADSYGSMAGKVLAAPITHLVPTPDGKGYWMVGEDGGIFSFGDAQFYGSMGGQPLNAPIVDLAPTPDGKGYWLVGSDGGVFAFGDAALRRLDGWPAAQCSGGRLGAGQRDRWVLAGRERRRGLLASMRPSKGRSVRSNSTLRSAECRPPRMEAGTGCSAPTARSLRSGTPTSTGAGAT